MNSIEIVRSWKDEDYRFGLSGEEQALAPDNPAEIIALGDEELMLIGGGTDPLTSIVITTPLLTTSIWPPITLPPFCENPV